MKTTFVFLLFSCAVSGFFFDGPEWSGLRAKWDLNPLDTYSFASLPLTEDDAKGKGFTKISDCDVNAAWRGTRYIKGNEHALILLYDVNGNIAGLQSSVPKGQSNGFPTSALQPPFVEDGGHWVMSVYLTDPSNICTTGRSETQVKNEGIGSDLYIQNGSVPESVVKVPIDEKDMQNTLWTKGKCFVSMGVHYWYNMTEDMSCERIFPIFLLFNGGRLNAFGFAFATNITDSEKRFEHPPQNAYGLFMVTPPKCLSTAGVISTLHVYFTNPLLNFC